MDHGVLVYIVDNLVQSSLLSSLVLTQYKYYNLSLELRLYLGKDLRVGKRNMSIGKV